MQQAIWNWSEICFYVLFQSDEKIAAAGTTENEEKNEDCIVQDLPTPDEMVQSTIIKSTLTENERKLVW